MQICDLRSGCMATFCVMLACAVAYPTTKLYNQYTPIQIPFTSLHNGVIACATTFPAVSSLPLSSSSRTVFNNPLARHLSGWNRRCAFSTTPRYSASSTLRRTSPKNCSTAPHSMSSRAMCSGRRASQAAGLWGDCWHLAQRRRSGSCEGGWATCASEGGGGGAELVWP